MVVNVSLFALIGDLAREREGYRSRFRFCAHTIKGSHNYAREREEN